MKKTKIICTIGPASEDKKILEQMIAAGMNVARLNFSHGDYSEHQRRIGNIRQAAAEKGLPVAIMLDTKGPEIRSGILAEGKVKLISGQTFVLTTRPVLGNAKEVQISYPDLPQEVKAGNTILLADGLINLLVKETTSTDIICEVINSGELGDKKGINIPGVKINMPFMSIKDEADIKFGIEQQVDFIAASFVRSADDVLAIRRILESHDADIDIIAKIESQSGVDNLEDIIKVADGIMVARGDLGVEISAQEVPLVQKEIVEKCINAGKIVIIATQMLESMIENPRPTRAEVSDVANAIFEGTDAIMLSGETAVGRYPVDVVATMSKIACRAEQSLPYTEILRKRRLQGVLSVTDAISYATCATAINLGASSIITATRTGYTPKMVAKYRPQAQIIAVSYEPKILLKLALVWGIIPLLISETRGTDDLFEESINRSLEHELVNYGDLIVLTAGIPTGQSGATNMLKVHVVGQILVDGIGIGLGVVKAVVRIVTRQEDTGKIQAGDIVVTTNADSYLAPYLQDMSALIAEEGGLTSNAAIMGLNYNVPVIVGAAKATELLNDGEMVTVDVGRGRVYKGLAQVL